MVSDLVEDYISHFKKQTFIHLLML